MLNTLITHWQEFDAARKTLPYNPDVVQGLGMRFHQTWLEAMPQIVTALPPGNDEKGNPITAYESTKKAPVMVQLIAKRHHANP